MKNYFDKPITYYAEKLRISYRKARRILGEPGGRARLEDMLITGTVFDATDKIPTTTEVVLKDARQQVVELNKDSLLECSRLFNTWTKADHKNIKYTYNDSARLAMSFIELCTKMSPSFNKKW